MNEETKIKLIASCLSIEFVGADKLMVYIRYHHNKLSSLTGFFHLANWLKARNIPSEIKPVWLGFFKIHWYFLAKYLIRRYNSGKLDSRLLNDF